MKTVHFEFDLPDPDDSRFSGIDLKLTGEILQRLRKLAARHPSLINLKMTETPIPETIDLGPPIDLKETLG
jgi:hypothetical protein